MGSNYNIKNMENNNMLNSSELSTPN